MTHKDIEVIIIGGAKGQGHFWPYPKCQLAAEASHPIASANRGSNFSVSFIGNNLHYRFFLWDMGVQRYNNPQESS